ncbi:GNAT family N-acetyltransferase [Roseateles depolymerans]|uniref:Acetyltransferase, ribosomal protein N-acetylase n=1 Tax=Roseateles depolymerans TaxID=76731 RepID=A0A0U3MFT9_9BURK|nr:GNAT family protein [Roseateles depolymerans]ALV06396.1 Acetyltransferase, ribosomal protein N-acetylase [Roseateles depolymerans]REG19368.1 RimJ/RimL family protein N-acetyltransferase [Roseateles depolymerans]
MTLHTRVTLRPTMLSDLDFVVGVEQDAANRPFITPWERPQHEGAIRFPDARHFVVELDAASVGFVILQGCRNPNRSVELKRIVLLSKGQGVGRECVRKLKALAFRQLGAHRFWLDVKGRNLRALQLYLSEGFVEEGRLRESVRIEGEVGADGADVFDDLIVMSLLRREFEARQTQGREPS